MIMSPGLEKWFANCNPMQYNKSFKYLPKSARALKTLAGCTVKMGICQWLAETDIITYFHCNCEDELQKGF